MWIIISLNVGQMQVHMCSYLSLYELTWLSIRETLNWSMLHIGVKNEVDSVDHHKTPAHRELQH